MSIPAPFIQDLLARVDAPEFIGRYVPLKKSGANFLGLCPFHNEKSPSFTVSPSKQFFHCFGCGKGGDVITFLMAHTGLGFADAVRELAAHIGVAVPQDAPASAAEIRQRQRRATLGEVMQQAAAAYSRHWDEWPQAAEWLRMRGLTRASARRFALGYAPRGWRTLANVFPQYDDPRLLEAGLVLEHVRENGQGSDGDGDSDGGGELRRYDRFRHRVMFPIRNVKGECIAFGARALGTEKPKYLNSPETPLFHKGRELYGLFEAREALRANGHALIVEGYMDVIALAQRGFAHTVATLGTACTAEHVRTLFRFTDALVFAFDGDAAGQRAAHKALVAALPWATDTRSVKFLFLPAEHDPDSFIRAHGPSGLARRVSEALPLSRFLIDSACSGCDLHQTEGRAHMASNARPLWDALPDGALKRQLLGEIARLAQLDARDLFDIWARQAAALQPRTPHSPHSPAPVPATTATPQPVPAWRRDSRDSRPPPARFAARPPAGAWAPRTSAAPGTLRLARAAVLLMQHMELMEEMHDEDWDALAHSPGSLSALFRWLETQFREHGARPFAVLREQLHHSAHGQIAAGLLDGPHAQLVGELPELRRELRDVLNRVLREHLAARAQSLALHAHQDPAAAGQLRQLLTRRQTLDQQIRAATR